MSKMTSIFIDVYSHDQETLIIRWHMSWLARGNQGPVCLYVTRVLMFPLNTVIAWHIILWTNEIWHQNTLYYLPLGHISFKKRWVLTWNWIRMRVKGVRLHRFPIILSGFLSWVPVFPIFLAAADGSEEVEKPVDEKNPAKRRLDEKGNTFVLFK
jgi:hypothetical protein